MRRIETRRAEGIARGGRHRQCGLTMVELLVAMAVGLFLLAGIVQLLVSSKTSYRAEEAFSRLQENGRFAMQTIARDARMARSMGCRSLMLGEVTDSKNVLSCDLKRGTYAGRPDASNCLVPNDPSYISTQAPLGFDASFVGGVAVKNDGLGPWAWTDLPGVIDDNNGRWRRGDVLVLWGVAGGFSYVSGVVANRNDPVSIPAANAQLAAGDIVLITDCEGSDLVTISTAPGAGGSVLLLHPVTHNNQRINASADLSRYYNRPSEPLVPGAVNNAMVFPFDFRIYFICDSVTAETGSALCRWRPRSGVQELVPDIVDMRVTYAADTDGDGTLNYASEPPTAADAISDWGRVYSAQVELLAASAAEVRSAVEAAVDPNWPGSAADKLGAGLPDDRRVYARFVFNVALRTRTAWYVRP